METQGGSPAHQYAQALWNAALRVSSDTGLAIGDELEELLKSRIQHVVIGHLDSFVRSPQQFEVAVKGFGEFMARVVQQAKRTDAPELSAAGYYDARERCGIIFWCEKP